MSSLALVLVIAAATLHATWNMLAKQSQGHPAFFWLALIASSFAYLPAFIVIMFLQPIPAMGWVWIVATGLLHTAYFWSLARAYERADLSLAYPLARGIGPTLVLIISVAIIGEEISPIGLAGVLVVVAGIYVTNLSDFGLRAWLQAPLLLLRPSGRYAAITGLIIGTYTLVDKQGVSVVNPLAYIYLMFLFSAIGITPLVIWHHGLRPWRGAPIRLRPVVTVAVLWVAAYLMVLIALTLAPTPYVSAAREVSILIGAGLGMTVLKEPRTLPRIVGVGAIAVGVVLVALA